MTKLRTGDVFTIKPLKWEQVESRYSQGYTAETKLGFRAFVALNHNSQWYCQTNGKDAAFCASPEEGKALAEARWQEYIKQGLEES